MNQINEQTHEERLKKLEASMEFILHRLETIELTLDVLAKEKLRKSPHQFADAIYSLLASCGTPLQRKEILRILGGSIEVFKKARKVLIYQHRMVDGTGTDLEANKICRTGDGYVVWSHDQVKEALERRARRNKNWLRKQETECC